MIAVKSIKSVMDQYIMESAPIDWQIGSKSCVQSPNEKLLKIEYDGTNRRS